MPTGAVQCPHTPHNSLGQPAMSTTPNNPPSTTVRPNQPQQPSIHRPPEPLQHPSTALNNPPQASTTPRQSSTVRAPLTTHNSPQPSTPLNKHGCPCAPLAAFHIHNPPHQKSKCHHDLPPPWLAACGMQHLVPAPGGDDVRGRGLRCRRGRFHVVLEVWIFHPQPRRAALL